MHLKTIDDTLLRVAGSEDAPILLLVHAFAETGYCFEHVVSCGLSTHFYVVVPDLWGFGASPMRSDVRTVADYAGALAELIERYVPSRRIGLVGHSVAAAMCVRIAEQHADKVTGVFSIEGNLTPADAMFTGRAVDYDQPAAFKRGFLEEIWQMGQRLPVLRHYYASAHVANPDAMWHLGRDTARISAGDQLGVAFQSLAQPALYYWSKESTPAATRAWIEKSGIAHRIYTGAGHWPMVEKPKETTEAIVDFFRKVSR